MGNEQKNRLGDKLQEKERAEEDRYFAKRDQQLMEKLKQRGQAGAEANTQGLAHMRCPKCGEHLQTDRVMDVSVDECPACKGTWLDRGELERAVEHEKSTGWFARYLKRIKER